MTIQQGISRKDAWYKAWALAITCAAGVAFWVPGMRACRGDFPVPLDDVFIHFDFARSLCRGHPFEWIAGQGFSSGETSPLYAAVLAIGWAVGFRGGALAHFAAGVAVASIAWAMVSLRALLPSRSVLVACVASALLVAIGALDFALFSGMEVALFVALAFRAFVLADRVVRAPPHLRASRQWSLGAIGALLVWTRPEAAVIVFVLSVLAARHARTQSPFAAMLRVASPGALATLAIAALNHAMTGDFASAGARLKLLSSNPYLGDLDRARELALNLLHFAWKVLEGSAVARPGLLGLLFACALVPLASRPVRDLGAAVLASAVLFALLVSFNGAARFQGFRYYAPAVAMLVLAVAIGLGTIARRSRALAIALGALFVGGAAWRADAQSRFFADASRNIHDQQRRVGEMLGESGAGRVLLGDAGAIPYFSDRSAIDALGLGGFRRLPFTRAALSGEGSTLELIQRLEPSERPSVLALFPNWFPATTSRFAREPLVRVTIDHNVICGGPTKLIAAADWSALDRELPPPNAVDELDVADIESEDAHDYRSPAPRGGFTVVNVLGERFDAGRIVPAGEAESFVANAAGSAIVLRSDDAIDAVVESTSGRVEITAPRASDRWTEAAAAIAVSRGDRVVIRARGWLRDFHVWIIR